MGFGFQKGTVTPTYKFRLIHQALLVRWARGEIAGAHQEGKSERNQIPFSVVVTQPSLRASVPRFQGREFRRMAPFPLEPRRDVDNEDPAARRHFSASFAICSRSRGTAVSSMTRAVAPQPADVADTSVDTEMDEMGKVILARACKLPQSAAR